MAKPEEGGSGSVGPLDKKNSNNKSYGGGHRTATPKLIPRLLKHARHHNDELQRVTLGYGNDPVAVPRVDMPAAFFQIETPPQLRPYFAVDTPIGLVVMNTMGAMESLISADCRHHRLVGDCCRAITVVAVLVLLS